VDCSEYKLNAGAGLTFEALPFTRIYFLSKIGFGLSGNYNPGYRIGPLEEIGVIVRPIELLSVQADSSYEKPVFGDTNSFYALQGSLRLSFTRQTELRASYDFYTSISQEWKASFNVYF
jgi:hypothetical protein